MERNFAVSPIIGKCQNINKRNTQGGPRLVISGVITPISRATTPVIHL